MEKQIPVLVAAALAALVPMLPLSAMAEERRPSFRLAMMDMMPMGSGGTMPQSAPGSAAMPGMGDKMDDDKMRMGGGAPAQGQNQMPMGQMAQPQQSMGMCPMMAMMQNMMRMSSGQQGMPPMQGGAASGGGMGTGMMGGGAIAGGTQPGGSSAARLEGRIAFLRTDLGITDAQRPAWESFATALRAGRDHLDAARAALADSSTGADPIARLESYENHMKARTEAFHTSRMAFSTLYSQFDEAQKRMATTTMLPFIGAF